MKLLGLTKSEALKYLHENNLDYRLFEKQPEIITLDFRPARFNLTIEDDIVVKVEKF